MQSYRFSEDLCTLLMKTASSSIVSHVHQNISCYIAEDNNFNVSTIQYRSLEFVVNVLDSLTCIESL